MLSDFRRQLQSAHFLPIFALALPLCLNVLTKRASWNHRKVNDNLAPGFASGHWHNLDEVFQGSKSFRGHERDRSSPSSNLLEYTFTFFLKFFILFSSASSDLFFEKFPADLHVFSKKHHHFFFSFFKPHHLLF